MLKVQNLVFLVFGAICAKNETEEKTFFKIPNRSTCTYLFLINSSHSFQNTMILSTELPDLQKMIITY